MRALVHQKCPACDVMLEFELIQHESAEHVDGSVKFTLHMQTTPESTEHVWTHHPDAEKP